MTHSSERDNISMRLRIFLATGSAEAGLINKSFFEGYVQLACWIPSATMTRANEKHLRTEDFAHYLPDRHCGALRG